MVKKSGSTKLKRQMAPNFWQIKRKGFPFALSVDPGPYSKDKCYPIGIILRDILHLCNTMHEAKLIMNSGQIKVDGIVRREVHFGVGIMDVIEVVPNGETYRMIPKDFKILVPVKTREKDVKLLKITSKVTIKGNKIQYGFHDGKTLISDNRLMSVGDVCLVKIPQIQIQTHIKFDVGCKVLIIQGENAGKIGQVDEIKNGMFSLPKRTVIRFEDRSVEMPISIVMPVGNDSPILEVFA
ncbi:MAG TPA: 30S ribosomal protein S4e [Candidatus Nitrosocosmicus sp.]